MSLQWLVWRGGGGLQAERVRVLRPSLSTQLLCFEWPWARAVKIMEKTILTGKRGMMVARETEILRRCSHPNLLTLYEVVETPTQMCLVARDGSEIQHMHLVFRLANCLST